MTGDGTSGSNPKATTKTVIPIAEATDEGAGGIGFYRAEAKIQPRAVSGRFVRWRWLLVALTQAVFYGLPWLEWGGRQAVLFDLGTRRFYILGLVLYPQDLIYLAALLIVSAYSLFLFTAVAGRLWCGFACPQTVYTEIFMWIERKCEGDRYARIKLDKAPWSLDKLRRRGGKQAAWIVLSLWTGFTFVGYFTPIHTLASEALGLTFGPWEWFWVCFYGFATWGNAGTMREQVCKYMCPYARFQSAMFDRDTMIVSYDVGRGDPRGSRPRSLPHDQLAAKGKGDCIDCGLCVEVCPTGIDIRKGLQYECIGCAACVDVCDGVMDKMHYPRGLVRFVTENGLDKGWNRAQMVRRVLRPRVLIYTSILCLIIVLLGLSLALRSPFRVDVIRDRGTLAREVEDGKIENVYRLQLMNASERPQHLHVEVTGLDGVQVATPADITLAPVESRYLPVRVQIPAATAAAAGPGVHHIHFMIKDTSAATARAALSEKSTFLIPR